MEAISTAAGELSTMAKALDILAEQFKLQQKKGLSRNEQIKNAAPPHLKPMCSKFLYNPNATFL